MSGKAGKSRFSFKRRSSETTYRRVPTESTTSGTSRSPSPTQSSFSGSTTQIPQTSDSDSDIDERTDFEKELFQLIDNGDSEAVRKFLKRHKAIDINKQDTEGLSVLHKAVKNEDGTMVDTLLANDLGIEINDALLHAIKENSMEMVQKLLNHKDSITSKQSVIKKLFPTKKIVFDSSEYGDDMTPLLMAAICGHYEMIELLYNRGERLAELHLPSCSCSICGKSSRDLKKSNNRIHLLKGLANPAYIAFMTGVDKSFDPVHKVFQLIGDIKTCIDDEPEFRDEYEEILDEVKPFPVQLLALCRNTDEAKVFLRNRSGYTGSSSLAYPRLLLALDLEQKEFVAHPHAQDVLYQEWIGEPWFTRNPSEAFMKKLFIILLILFFPIISMGLWIILCCCYRVKLVRYLTSPVNRFRSYCATYAIFMLVIFYMNSTERAPADIGPPAFYLPWIVGIFVISHFMSFMRHLLLNPRYFMTSGWSIFELVNHILFFITIGLWIALWFVDRSGMHGTKRKHLTIMRSWLDPYDLLLLSEVTTGIASCMAGVRLLKVFILHPTIGPLQIALGKMSKDIFTFALFFSIIIVSFSLGTQHLYRPYVSFTDAEGNSIGQMKELASFHSAVESFFWALFTMTDSGTPAVAEIPLGGDVTNHHFFTESVGKIIFIGFHILAVTFLMNMLVGIMASTYGNILENVGTEWRYARSQMWVYFIQDTVVAPPLNIIPNVIFLLNIFAWIRLFTSSKPNDKKQSDRHMEHAETESEKKEREKAYPILLRRLLQRYFRSTSSIASENTPMKKDITTVQNHVTELKEMTKLTLAEHEASHEALLSPKKSLQGDTSIQPNTLIIGGTISASGTATEGTSAIAPSGTITEGTNANGTVTGGKRTSGTTVSAAGNTRTSGSGTGNARTSGTVVGGTGTGSVGPGGRSTGGTGTTSPINTTTLSIKTVNVNPSTLTNVTVTQPPSIETIAKRNSSGNIQQSNSGTVRRSGERITSPMTGSSLRQVHFPSNGAL